MPDDLLKNITLNDKTEIIISNATESSFINFAIGFKFIATALPFIALAFLIFVLTLKFIK